MAASKSKISAVDAAKLWHVVDAKNQVVGRVAPQIAKLLMGKHKPTFMPHVDGGDYVVVLNAAKVAFTGTKATTKLYRWHTGWMGGLKTLTARQMMERDPRRVLQHAVKGMLPNNALRKDRLRRLRVFPEGAHDHEAQVSASSSHARAHVRYSQPLDVRPRAKADTGALVVDAADIATPEEIASIQWTKLEHDPAFAARYEGFLARQAARRARYHRITDERILARAKELDEAERALQAAAGGAAEAAAGAGAGAGAGGRPRMQ